MTIYAIQARSLTGRWIPIEYRADREAALLRNIQLRHTNNLVDWQYQVVPVYPKDKPHAARLLRKKP